MPVAKPVLAANWKMHHGPDDARAFFERFLDLHAPASARTVLFFPPALTLSAARDALAGRDDIGVGVQNLHWEAEGAFTGEISAPMARQAGAGYALVGHSERRQLFGESAADTARKTRAALDAGLTPVLCVGETLDQREAGRAEPTVFEQLDAVLDAVSTDEAARLLIAYEPVWAIGTGRTASPDDAQAMHAAIRARLRERVAGAAAGVPILYGGSVKPHNVEQLLAGPDVDGALVGGASLDADAFAAISGAGA